MKKIGLGTGILLVVAATIFTFGYVQNVHKKQLIQKYLPENNEYYHQSYIVYFFPDPGHGDPLLRQIQTILQKDNADIRKVGYRGINPYAPYNKQDRELLQALNIDDPSLHIFVLDTIGKVVLKTEDPNDLDQFLQTLGDK